MKNESVPERIRAYNADRNPVFLAGKFAAMRESAFRFFRGTSHLFNTDIPANSLIWQAPLTWSVGDLHIENFGSFKGDNRVPYFDLNDFDECVLSPALSDLARLTCSIYVSAPSLKLSEEDADSLTGLLMDMYAQTLTKGLIRPLEQETATGIIRHFLRSVGLRKRGPFLKRFVRYRKHTIRFRRRNIRLQSVTDESTRHQIGTLVSNWAESQPDPRQFRVLDIAHRLAGTGSLGIRRYAILVGHSLEPGKQLLLDLKQAVPSTLADRLADWQPAWPSEAARIVAVQQRIQAASPALLHAINLPNHSFVLRELQPIDDRIALADLIGKPKKLALLIGTMGQLCAWGNLRSSGRQGSAIADELIDFGQRHPHWQPHLLDYARTYARQVQTDYDNYCQAYDAGYFQK